MFSGRTDRVRFVAAHFEAADKVQHNEPRSIPHRFQNHFVPFGITLFRLSGKKISVSKKYAYREGGFKFIRRYSETPSLLKMRTS